MYIVGNNGLVCVDASYFTIVQVYGPPTSLKFIQAQRSMPCILCWLFVCVCVVCGGMCGVCGVSSNAFCLWYKLLGSFLLKFYVLLIVFCRFCGVTCWLLASVLFIAN